MIGLAEMMNFPGVIAGDPHELEKLALGASHVDGHAPGVLGKDLQAMPPPASAPTTSATRPRRAASACAQACGC